MLNIRIHGDNIVECERAWTLIKTALFGTSSIKCNIFGSAVSPCYEIRVEELDHVVVQFFPGYGRWSPNILEYMKHRGALLREASDAIVCVLSKNDKKNTTETPIVAIEFCAALPAGNQAWQRCGRAYSLTGANIPYIYINEIGGFELDAQRREKAMRLPNPIVPFAYITHSLQCQAPSLPILLPSCAITDNAKKMFSGCFSERELLVLIKSLIYQRDLSGIINSVISKTLNFVNVLSVNRSDKDTYTHSDWNTWIKLIQQNKNVPDFICLKQLSWRKVAYIEGLTPTAKDLIAGTSTYAIGIGARNVPICLIHKSMRALYAKMLVRLYPGLAKEFREWMLNDDKDLCLCFIMGFKPRGDDARPDRGLPPLARMLLGNDVDLLTVVYGPAKTFMWPLFRNNPLSLARQNGLWESIMAMSDAVLIDSATDKGVTKKGYLRSHWGVVSTKPTSQPISIIDPWPRILGENDVDTVIHLLLSSASNNDIFEGMCNPPGGDWSGVSIVESLEKQTELRWLSLPRISGSGSKRPDHVFQFFKPGKKPIILAIESKANERLVEVGVGKRLTRYIRALLSTPSSAQRNIANGMWRKASKSVQLSNFRYASAIAYLMNKDSNRAKNKANVDLVFGVVLAEKNMSASVSILPCSPIGVELASIINNSVRLKELPISIIVF